MKADNSKQGMGFKASRQPTYMKIDTNTSPIAPGTITPPKTSAIATNSVTDDTSFTGSTALAVALGETPDIRSSEVDRARQLINDPNYPSAATIKSIANHLADKLTSSEE